MKNIKISNEKEEKIFFGEKQKRCFACGQVLDIGVEECPYCKTKQNIEKKSRTE
ncbi:MAG: hypothetical protein GF353_09570 [Candidatus Lokiarchaeota archaeon]|nr:hypothetical protein [Candidatus Lokiarchaeota archaeon]